MAAWLDKQNKQLLIAIISLRSTPLRQAEEDGSPHGGEKNMCEGSIEYVTFITNAIYGKVMVTFPDSWFNSSTSL